MTEISNEDELRAQHLWKIGNTLSKTCPSVSRYYLYNFEKNISANPSSTEKTDKKSNLYCNHCGSLWAIDNHKVHVQPPPKPCGCVKALLKKSKTDPMMSRKDKKKVKKFLEKQQSKIVYTCFVCEKKTEIPGIVKPGRQVLKVTTQSTPLPKIKVKKRDLNAGLFLNTPEDPCKRSDNPVESTKSRNTSEVQSSITPSNPTVKPSLDLKTPRLENSSKKLSTPGSCNKTPTTLNNRTPINSNNGSIQKSQKKKKKSLSSLSLSLNEQQNSSKKKKSLLSSFLVSL